MKLFEAVLILTPGVDFNKKMKEYEQVFKHTTDHMYLKDLGVKNLAYPQKNYARGHYVIFYFNSTTDWVTHDFDLYCRRDNDVLKFMTTDMQEPGEDFNELERIDLVNPNRRIDAMDVILGLAEYKKKEVI